MKMNAGGDFSPPAWLGRPTGLAAWWGSRRLGGVWWGDAARKPVRRSGTDVPRPRETLQRSGTSGTRISVVMPPEEASALPGAVVLFPGAAVVAGLIAAVSMFGGGGEGACFNGRLVGGRALGLGAGVCRGDARQ